MKRTLIIIGTSVVLAALTVGGVLVSALTGRQSLKDGDEINGARVVADGITSATVVPINDRDVALIDAGNDAEGKALLAELSRRNLGPNAVVAICLTHGHGDHRGAISKFPKAQIVALETEIPVVEGRETGGGPLNRLFGARPSGIHVSHSVKDGETVSIGGKEFKVFAVPGHTPGSGAYLVDGVLYLGDAADLSKEGKLMRSSWAFSNSQSQDEESLHRLIQRLQANKDQVTAVICSHSGMSTRGFDVLAEFEKP